MKAIGQLIFCAIAMFASAGDAQVARVYTLTTRGVVTDGYDYSGLFGSVGAVVGQNYVMAESFSATTNSLVVNAPNEQCRFASSDVAPTQTKVMIGATSYKTPTETGWGQHAAGPSHWQ